MKAWRVRKIVICTIETSKQFAPSYGVTLCQWPRSGPLHRLDTPPLPRQNILVFQKKMVSIDFDATYPLSDGLATLA